MAPSRSNENPLTALVVDVSPVAWGDRDLRRTASDRQRKAAGKASSGQPLILEELLVSIQAFASAFVSLERDSALFIVAVAGNEVSVVYPRKDDLEAFFSSNESKQDSGKMQTLLIQGVAELVARAAKGVGEVHNQNTASNGAIASGLSVALCLINRFLVATNSGVSALHSEHAWNRGNADDEGVIAAIGGSGKKASNKRARAWSPRTLVIQASDDRPSDYNAIMNCAFASVKHRVVVDGCFLRCDDTNASSAFLEQTCDLTGGLFLPLSAAAQANKALTEVLLSVFLPPRSCRSKLNLPAINEVDFRARSFDTGKSTNIAFVCNQCLSIFEEKPKKSCPTCLAEIRSKKNRSA
mmetsp:Transcript_18013/g.44508  ORF Transcript_18013/g.44508 Transcript_18013/m.44508 type:complete len:354 (-) Transcript_18013:4023-5084(-)